MNRYATYDRALLTIFLSEEHDIRPDQVEQPAYDDRHTANTHA
ncbi:hypothetical protein ABMB68_009472 [Bradyrhizobium sp. RT4a]